MRQTIKYIQEKLSGLYDRPEIDSFCFLIINHLLGFSKSEMILNQDYTFSDSDVKKAHEITSRLIGFEPIQYIVGQTEFYGLPFFVEPGVLIPRFETEELVDLIIRENKGFSGNILDIGTGSGCIAISLAKYLPSSSVTGTDISHDALVVAQGNAGLNNVKVEFIEEDIFNPHRLLTGRQDIIVSNPPYVLFSEKTLMNKNVLEHEPHDALFVNDSEPFLYYKSILHTAEKILLPGGKIYFEINEAMGKDMIRLIETFRYSDIKLFKDINGKDRIIRGILNG